MDKAKRIAASLVEESKRDLIAAQKLATELPDIAIYHCQQGGRKKRKVSLFCTIKSWRHNNINSLVEKLQLMNQSLQLP